MILLSLIAATTTIKCRAAHVDCLLEEFANHYAKTRRPLRVSFRDLTPDLGSSDRLTHLIHPYPAKLLANIPYFFLATQTLSKPGDLVLDPFCGSGTVLLEAIAAHRIALGADSNPLARLVSEVKTRPIAINRLRRMCRLLVRRVGVRKNFDNPPPDVVHLRYWFHPHVVRQLAAIRSAIDEIEEPDLRAFLLVALSRCVREVSLADPRVSVPVRLRADQYSQDHWLHERTISRLAYLRQVNVFNKFRDAVEENMHRMETLCAVIPNGLRAGVISPDARNLTNEFAFPLTPNGRLPDASVQLAITSPPYAGAQKYIRACSLSLGWLGQCPSNQLASLERATIGREHYRLIDYDRPLKVGVSEVDRRLDKIRRISPLRAHIFAQYLVDMRAALVETARALKPNGHLVLVAAANTVCGQSFPTFSYLQTITKETGFTEIFTLVDRIRGRSLMTRRNGTASVIPNETITLFRRDH